MRRAVLLAVAIAALLALFAPDALAAPGWLPATVLPGSGPESVAPGVAMDPAGDSVAVWKAYIGTEERVEAASRPAGGSWGAPVILSPPGLETYDNEVVISPSGEATATWSTDGGEQVVQVATMSPDGKWSGPVTLSDPTLIGDAPSLAVDSAGNLTAAWMQYGGVNFVVVVSTRGADGIWTSPKQLSPAVGSAQSPSVAVDDQGDAVVVWNQQLLQAEAATRRGGGAWSQPVELSEGGEEIREATVAMDAAGEAVVTWDRYDGTEEVVQSATMSPAGSWTEAIDLSDGTYGAYEPKVAIDPEGEAIVVWEHSSPKIAVVEGRTRPPGSGWSPTAALTPLDQESGDASIAMNPAGLAVLVWQGGPLNTKSTPYGAARPQGGGWSAPQGLAANAKAGNYPLVATDADGDAVAAWESYGDGSSDEIEAAGFDGAGPRLSAVSVPSSGQVGEPLAFSVKATDVWSAVQQPFWQFGDHTGAKGDSVTHGYLNGGTYPVGVTVTDALGNSTLANGGPVAVAAMPTHGHGTARARRRAAVKKGRAALELLCAGGECTGAAKLYAPPPRGGHRRRRRPVLVGEGSFQIASGGHELVKVKLRPNALVRLHRSATGHLVTTLRGAGVDPGKVTLHEAKPKQKQHRHR
jgi:hypothetical protein